MDFNEYWKIGCFGEYHDIYSKNLAEKFYKAGQESKQSQIDRALELLRQPMQGTIADLLNELEDILDDN